MYENFLIVLLGIHFTSFDGIYSSFFKLLHVDFFLVKTQKVSF